MPTGADPDLLLAGEIGKPHGTAGEVYVTVISDDPRRFEPAARLQHENGVILTVETARRHRNRFLVKFEGIDDREGAEAARGALFVPASRARALEDDEFWQHELMGCRVVTRAGDEVGVVGSIVTGPAQDLLVVGTPSGERLVPVVKEIVVEVDLARRLVTIDPPEGLLS